MPTGITAWEAWRATRHADVTAAQGDLALVETTWVDGEQPDLVDVLAAKPATMSATTVTRSEIDGTVIARGYRLWDAQSAAIKAFVRIDAFAYDPAWVLTGHFEPFTSEEPVPFEFSRPDAPTRELGVPGEVVVTIADREYRLHAFAKGEQLQLVFGDPTNGAESYGTGRFLLLDLDGDSVTLDFNRAFIPPCGFSMHFNCPLPPTNNRLHVPVRAGEQFPVFRDDFTIYAF